MTDETERPVPVQDPAVHARVRALHAAGKGRNAIAEELGLSTATISRVAKLLGLDFSRTQTAVAVQARVTSLADMRTRLAEKMAAIADEQLDRARQPYLVYSFGGQYNEYAEHELEQPPAEAARTMVATAAMAFDKVTKYLEKDTSGVETAHSLLDTLAAGFAAAAATYENPTEEAP